MCGCECACACGCGCTFNFRREINEKGLKSRKKVESGSKKSISTSFQVRAAPENWSKFTTPLLPTSYNMAPDLALAISLKNIKIFQIPLL